MKNYYEILRISPNITEKDLLKELSVRLTYYNSELTDKNDKLDSKTLEKINVIMNFKKTLDSYGGKEGYDKALKMSNGANVIRIKDYRKKRYAKLALAVGSVLGAVIISTTVINDMLYTEKVIPIDGLSYNDFKEEYDLTRNEIKEFGLKEARVKVKNDKADELNEKIKAHEDAKNITYYSFDYEVEFNDTISVLAQRFKTTLENVNRGEADIISGETIEIKTPEKDIADIMQKEYDENHKPLELDYIYTIKKGDNIKIIEDKTNVPASIILRFNGKEVSDILYAGEKLQIPKIPEKDMVR